MEEDIRELELERWVNISERSGVLSGRNEHEQKHRGIALTGVGGIRKPVWLE